MQDKQYMWYSFEKEKHNMHCLGVFFKHIYTDEKQKKISELNKELTTAMHACTPFIHLQKNTPDIACSEIIIKSSLALLNLNRVSPFSFAPHVFLMTVSYNQFGKSYS